MSLLEIVPMFRDLFGLIGKAIPDKDKQAELQARMVEIQAQVTEALATLTGKCAELEANVRIAELNTKTYPWVDAVHKMGRQLNGWLLLSVAGGCAALGHPLEPATITAVAAVMGVYNFVKGKGQ